MAPVMATPPASLSASTPPAVVRPRGDAPYGWTRHTVRPGDTVAALALAGRTTVEAIVAKNHLRGGGHLIRPGQSLWLPRTKPVRPATPRKAAELRLTAYRVRSGDTLSAIAHRTGTTVARLVKLNRLSTTVIRAGTGLRVPLRPAAPPRKPRPTPSSRPTSVYVVRTGDTLGAIARGTRTPLRTLLALNRLSVRSRIYPGERVRVLAPPAATRPAVARYAVRSGDTLSGIAHDRGTTTARLLKLNRLADPNHLRVGQSLAVPQPVSRKAFSSNTFAGRTYSAKVVAAAAANRAALARKPVPSRAQTKALIVATARGHGVDPRLALAVAWQESGWDQRQVSVANAIGTMQVVPTSGRWASDMAGRRLNLLSARDNITAGVVILRALTRSADSLDQAIAGYYQGLASVQQHGMYPDTKQYVKAVKAHRTRM